MAVDTAAKRASVLGVGRVYVTLLPPDGAIASEDRQNIVSTFGGFGVAVAPGNSYYRSGAIPTNDPTKGSGFYNEADVTPTEDSTSGGGFYNA